MLSTAITTAAEQREPGKAGGNKPARRVLVVEDQALICLEAAATFEHHGFEVHIALSGEEAFRLLCRGLKVDILFTDIDLGGRLDGLMLARLARELMPDVAVLYTSGSVEVGAQGVAGSAFVPKPYSADLVGRMLGGMSSLEMA